MKNSLNLCPLSERGRIAGSRSIHEGRSDIAGNGAQRQILVHFQQFACKYADENGDAYDNHVDHYGFRADSYDTLESEPEPVEDDSQPQYLF